MRILILLDSFAENEIGVAVLRLLQRLAAMREITLQVAAFGADGPLSERLREISVGTRQIPWGGLRHAKALQQIGQKLFARADRPDLLMSYCAWPALPARFLHGGDKRIPLACAVSTLEPLERQSLLTGLAHSAAERTTRSRLSAIIIPEPRFRSELVRRGFPDALIRHQPIGVDALQIFPLSESGKRRYRKLVGIPEESPLIVFTGRPHGKLATDASEMLVAMARVRQKWPSAMLFLVGDGIPTDVLRRPGDHHLFTRQIGSLSELHGRLNSSADVVVVSTVSGAFPLGAAEAQASGTAVIALTEGPKSPSPTLDPLAKAVTIPREHCAVSLAEQVELLLADRALASRRGTEAREYIMENFELSSAVDALAHLWRELAPEASWKATDSIPLYELEDLQRESNTPPAR
jgi:glycosyltransferase involved in cell wall biosynthesis